jgi:inhibitor of growth protein 3
MMASATKHEKNPTYSMNEMLPQMDSPSPNGAATTSTYPLQHMGPGGNAIAQAASQAIAATQQLTGRRTSSLKASFEAINLGVQTHEFSIGRELAGAAQTAIASTSFSSSLDGGGPPPNKKKKTKSSDHVLDVVSDGLLDEALLDPSLTGHDLLGASIRDPDWNYDPSEPRYCVCNQVSYGDMVACDNEDVSCLHF